MHDSLGDSLSVEVSEFVDQVEVLEQDWASWSGSHGVLVVVDGITSGSGQNFTFHIFWICDDVCINYKCHIVKVLRF